MEYFNVIDKSEIAQSTWYERTTFFGDSNKSLQDNYTKAKDEIFQIKLAVEQSLVEEVINKI